MCPVNTENHGKNIAATQNVSEMFDKLIKYLHVGDPTSPKEEPKLKNMGNKQTMI